jgi:hypothetical protein
MLVRCAGWLWCGVCVWRWLVVCVWVRLVACGLKAGMVVGAGRGVGGWCGGGCVRLWGACMQEGGCGAVVGVVSVTWAGRQGGAEIVAQAADRFRGPVRRSL